MKTNWTRVCGRTPAKSPRGRKRRRRGTQTRMPPNYPGSGAAAPIGQRETWRCYLRTTPYALTAARRRAQSRLHRCRIPRKGAGVRACHRSDCSPPHLDLVTKKEVALASLGASQYCKPETPGPQRSCGLPLRNVPRKDPRLSSRRRSPRGEGKHHQVNQNERVKIDTRNHSLSFGRLEPTG